MELDNLSRIKQDDKWIFCDERGNNVLNQGFYYIDSFINRKARLRRGTRRWNIINSDGSFFFKNDARQISPESDGFFAVLFKNRKSNYLKVSDWSFLLKENCEMCFSFREGMGRIFDSDGSTNYVNVYGEKILKNGCYFGKDFS
ncbi:MAG: hypothetical protein RMM16_06435, partial [Chloroherpetonaceae bacterium]|nr:hypothetical protein [Chloroherpetonaceae bacterium]